MPELTPTGAADVVERQVRRVRRRKNLYELQRTLYLAIAAGAGAAALVLPFALFASAEVFAIVAGSTLAVLAGLLTVLLGALRRRWLAPARAVAWIEARAGLGGRLQTLLELRPGSGFFHALLALQVGSGLIAWAPRRVVPRSVPRAAGGAALAAVTALILTFRLASLALPTPPTISMSDRPLVGERSERIDPLAGERIVVAPGIPSRTEAGAAPATDDGTRDDSPLTQLSSALQENVRHRVWGKAWERVRDALARAGTTRSAGVEDADGSDQARDDEADGDSDASQSARGPTGEATRRHRSVADGKSAEPLELDAETGAMHTAGERTNSETDLDSDPEGGRSAGNGTSPGDLFDGAPVDAGASNGSFELSLAARMRSDRTGRRGASGPAPDADPDARPLLAPEQRRETAAHRMAVPAAYEQVVREVFSHRENQ
jgi:hypothetical protein